MYLAIHLRLKKNRRRKSLETLAAIHLVLFIFSMRTHLRTNRHLSS